MSTMLHDLSIFDYCIAGAIAVLMVFILGAIAHAVLKDTGFGMVLNGVVLLFGALSGVFARALTIGFQ